MTLLTQESLPRQQLLHPWHDAALRRAFLPQVGAHQLGTSKRPPQLRPMARLTLAGPLYYRRFDMSVPKAVHSNDSAYRFRPVRFTRNETDIR